MRYLNIGHTADTTYVHQETLLMFIEKMKPHDMSDEKYMPIRIIWRLACFSSIDCSWCKECSINEVEDFKRAKFMFLL